MARYTNRFDAKRDANEKEIVNALKTKGLGVYRLDQPLDLLVCWGGLTFLIEVKMPGKDLNQKQLDFVKDWRGSWHVVRSLDDVETVVSKIKNQVELYRNSI